MTHRARSTALSDSARPFSAGRHSERRPGETILIAHDDRRPVPAGGVRVLMLGGSLESLMMQGFLVRDLPAVAHLDPAADTAAALAALARDPDRYDLLLVVGRHDCSAAVAVARDIGARLDACGSPSPGPFVVGLSERLWPGRVCDAGNVRALAGFLQLPLSHHRFASLLADLFTAAPRAA